MSYHINSRGEPAECHAAPGECPLGGEHFSTTKEASDHLEEVQSESLFTPHKMLMMNNLDDAFTQPKVNDVLVGSDGLTMGEEFALDRQELVEDEIAQHKKAVRQGYSPYELDNLSRPPAIVKRHGDPEAYTRAIQAQDYDKLRRVYAEANARALRGDPDFRLTAEDLIARSKR